MYDKNINVKKKLFFIGLIFFSGSVSFGAEYPLVDVSEVSLVVKESGGSVVRAFENLNLLPDFIKSEEKKVIYCRKALGHHVYNRLTGIPCWEEHCSVCFRKLKDRRKDPVISFFNKIFRFCGGSSSIGVEQ